MIKVIIERIIADDMESTYEAQLKNTLTAVMGAKGFISGTSYVDINNKNKRTIITDWQNIECWKRWHKSEVRSEANSQIRLMLAQEEVVTTLESQPLA
ncbi:MULTISPECIES: antibiotic biosynthesis monooxygenase [unclassified Pseudoalteromonas]|uniref:antibiotic biosynthesis monooxygenase family protein n=1 Tax=unclassified Pseudoalteromonas TaxID=194690 RepID=UPI0005A9AE02|nr:MULTISPECIES: antibiotic biosynthesis monooxygenase [unclassified Pseudoalteromonas]